ncbi:restriction endonuclease [Fusobacterium necrophorum]|uniref:Restriction endonuclease n=1 Tax=Fusobacterium necrophorum TaxID=859 RepID=A0AAW6WD10_9FUSO|nr:restriction endonuclease [Fusobacterium necrophorum]MDK4481959.1 restriction endonuclease [Fusobacterium necrophorum]MDK4512571.1 restriction endonuclease [Fusobacterium necrophorum]
MEIFIIIFFLFVVFGFLPWLKHTIDEFFSSKKYRNENQVLMQQLPHLEKQLRIKYEQGFKEMEKEYSSKTRGLEEEKEKFEAQKSLSIFKLNSTMMKIFDEYTEKRLNAYEKYFYFKKNPSWKSADYIKGIKKEYKRLEKENRELNLLLSEFIEEEQEEIELNNSFDDEEKAFEYGKIEKNVWDSLTYIEKLDIILEKYASTWKNKLNIGLEFERYCGYIYEKRGFQVKYWGILKGKSDGGIDLIAKKKEKTLYIQCKYWSKYKFIRENTVTQLFGAALKFAIDNRDTYESFITKVYEKKIEIILLTKTELSEEAKEFCKKLNISYIENIEIENYPRVKLVEGLEKIFYIPTDLQYDNISFLSTNKKYSRAISCKEANELGYRHCYRWKRATF